MPLNLEQMEQRRLAEAYSFQRAKEEAVELAEEIDNSKKPQDLIEQNFNLSALMPEWKIPENRCQSSQGYSYKQMKDPRQNQSRFAFKS